MTNPLARTLAGLLLAALVAAPVVAHAEAIAVLGVEADGVSEAQANLLVEALRSKARETSGVKFVPSKDFMEMKFLYNCMDPATIASCLAPAGKSVGAEKLVFGTLTLTKKKKVHVSIKLVDVGTGAVVKFVDEEVKQLDVNGSAGRWFASLVPPSAATPVVTPPPTPRDGQIAVSSEPSGADVTVDGANRGTTPTNVSAKPGSHTVVIAKSGYESETRTLTVRAGENEKLDLSLKKKPEPVATVENPPITQPPITTPPPATEEHPGRTAIVVGGVALAVALIGGGIAIYTFKHYSDLQDTTHSELDMIRSEALGQPGGSAWVSQNKDFFQKSPTCDVPGGGPPVAGYNQFKNDCASGNTFATITTVLDIAAGALAAAGIISLAYGVRASRKAADSPKTTSFAPRLRLLSPVVSTSGGGLQAAFEF
jgi:hypothetical protein